jgi:hypothetical protein
MMRFALLPLLSGMGTWAQTAVLGDQFTVSTTPTQFSSTMAPVQSIRFQVIPGYCGKMYIGLQGMNIATYTKVLSILWPNCTGGPSESFTLRDLSGNNGIDPTTLFIVGGTTGEQLAWSAVRNGSSIGNVDGETPAGTIDGTNVTFTLSRSPNPSASLLLARNGVLMNSQTDFTISGNTITFAAGSIPQVGDALMAWYRY